MRILNRLPPLAGPITLFGALALSSQLGHGADGLAHAARVQPSTLVLIGGGVRPTEALNAWIQGASRSGASPRLGAIAWASGESDATLNRLREELRPLTPASLETPPVDPTPTGFKAQDLPRVIAWLSQLDGLYFTGGDQNRLLTIFQQHPEIPTQIRKHYESGLLAVAGTSAGTAIQGSRVFTGNEDLTVIQPETLDLQPGLALLPEAIVDQHFLRRQRHNRMLSALQAQPRLVGVGVDEDTALILESQRSGKGWTRRGRVHGRGQALLFTPKAGSNGKQLDLLISPNLDCLEWSTDTSAPKTRGCD